MDDQNKTLEELLALAEQDPMAQYQIACRYLTGNGVCKDPAEAVVWLTKAADQGLARAQDRLGLCYLRGTGVAVDLEKAAAYFALAARQGDPLAEVHLGCCYDEGMGIQ